MHYVRNCWKTLVIALTVILMVFFFLDICVHVDMYCFLFIVCCGQQMIGCQMVTYDLV